jgi:hypothetical protein
MAKHIVSNPQGEYEVEIDDAGNPLSIRTRIHTSPSKVHTRKLWERNGKPMSITARCAWNAYNRKVLNDRAASLTAPVPPVVKCPTCKITVLASSDNTTGHCTAHKPKNEPLVEPATVDMRVHVREMAELAITYAEDGAYHSAARVLGALAGEVQAHANMVQPR